MSDDAIENEEPIIPEEHFREAIAACRQDPELDRYFRLAPPGARLFIGLSFYSTHFGDKTDTAQYKVCLSEIEPSLTPNDLKYLIRFERDKETKRYLKELLAKREAEALEVSEPDEETSVIEDDSEENAKGSEPVVPAEPTPPPARSPAKGNTPLTRIRGVGASMKGLKLIADAEPSASERTILPIVLGVGVVLLFSLVLLASSRAKVGRELERRTAEVANLQHRLGELQQELERTRSELRTVRSAVEVKTAVPVPVPVRQDEEKSEAGMGEPAATDVPVSDEGEETPHVPVEKNGEQESAGPAKPERKVVFTDGRSIVRKSNGKLIEVPRTFSYAGAGLKKPFWIYDRKLGDAKMETEAKLEKKARDEWRALHDEAMRQAPPGENR